MHRTALLCQWPQRPSDIWDLRAQGYTANQCRDFDFGVLDFWQWLESKRAERVQRRDGPEHKTKDGHHWESRYRTDAEILKRYYPEQVEVLMDPVVAAMTDADVAALVDDWILDTMGALGPDDQPSTES